MDPRGPMTLYGVCYGGKGKATRLAAQEVDSARTRGLFRCSREAGQCSTAANSIRPESCSRISSRRNPNAFDALNGLGFALVNLGKAAEAKPHFEIASD